MLVKLGLHIVVAIRQHACDHVLKRFENSRLQIFLVKYEQLPSLQLCESQSICGNVLTLNRPGFLQIGMAGGGQIPPPL